MILQHILEVFDKELDRLHQLREIVLTLGRPSVISAAQPLEALVTPLDELARDEGPGKEITAEPKVVTRRATPGRSAAASATRAPRLAKAALPSGLEQSALRGSIPKGPVVVPAAQARALAVKTAARATPVAAQPPVGSLGSMIRALRLEPS